VTVLVGLEVLTDTVRPGFADLVSRLNDLDADYDELLLAHTTVHGDSSPESASISADKTRPPLRAKSSLKDRAPV